MSSTPTPPASTPPPIIQPSDLKFYLSGGYFNSEPNNSLGGEISSFAIASGALNNLFDRVDTAEATQGDTEYRCIYLRNVHQTRKLLGVRIWIETGTLSNDTNISVSIGSAGINGVEPMIPSEVVAPPMQFFEVPLSMPDDPNIGDLFPGDQVGLWFRWSVQPGTKSLADDKAVIRIDGEREPEPSSGIPDPTDPPPDDKVCPTGWKWDPTTNKCVLDSTVIVCPDGYTYNNTTQRCEPPSTPPPSVATFKYAVNGDFSCTSDNDATMALVKSKLNVSPEDLFIANGDLSYNDGDQSCWIDSTRDLAPIYPDRVAPTIGNHDDSEDGTAEDRTTIINHYPLIPTEGYYALTRRNIHFIFMDTQRTYNRNSPQYNFTVAELDKAKNDPNIKWVIVSYHKPSINSDGNHGALTDFRDLYHPLFEANGKVCMTNTGHNHIYWRSKPLKFNASAEGAHDVHPQFNQNGSGQNYVNISGWILHVITGTGGRRSNHTFGTNQPVYCANRRLPPPYGTTFVTLEDNGNRLNCEYILNNGTVFDKWTISIPGASNPPPGGINCPQGYNWDETQGKCIPSVITCPINYKWDPVQQRCVPLTGEPPKDPNVLPITNVEWFYDSTVTQAASQTINTGNYDATEGIIQLHSTSTVTSMSISNGYINLLAPNPNNSIYRMFVDYWKKTRWTQDRQAKQNIVGTLTFVYENQRSISIYDGNWRSPSYTPNTQFGGFGFTIIGPQATSDGARNQTNSTVHIFIDTTTYQPGTGATLETESVPFPGNRTLENGKTYRIFWSMLANHPKLSVELNLWMDFGDGMGWIRLVTNRAWTNAGWILNNPPVFGAEDQNQIWAGPNELERRRILIRNNNETDVTKPTLRLKDIKIGTIPYIGIPPGDPDPQPPPGSEGEVIWDSNVDGKWNNGVSRTITGTEGSQAINGKGIYMAASGNPRLVVDGAGVGTLTVDGGGNHGRFYVKACNYNVRVEGEFKLNQSDISSFTFKWRNRHQMGGDCENRFGGFGGHFRLSPNEAGTQIELCHNEHEGSQDTALSPAITTNTWYTFKFTVQDQPTSGSVLQKIELDRGSGFTTVHTATKTNPPGYYVDKATFLANSEGWFRLNSGSGTGSVSLRNIKIYNLDAVPPGNPPPPPPGNPPPDNPPPGGGQTDANGILWFHATGQQGVINQTRTDANDFRWSGNVSGANIGMEVTAYFTFSGVASGGHFALKHGGPNHSGCSSSSSCAWYDTGIRSNGEVQLQTERPHPNNHDFTLPNSEWFIKNVGVSMDGRTIGLKWFWMPTNYPNGSTNNGGCKCKMWVDTSGLLNGRPQNQWKLVYEFMDTGQVLSNFTFPSTQDVEIRNSDTDDVTTYAGGLHWRKVVR